MTRSASREGPGGGMRDFLFDEEGEGDAGALAERIPPGALAGGISFFDEQGGRARRPPGGCFSSTRGRRPETALAGFKYEERHQAAAFKPSRTREGRPAMAFKPSSTREGRPAAASKPSRTRERRPRGGV